MVESLIGGLFGGLLRLAPEALKFFDRKNERDHELRMLNAEIEISKHKLEATMHQAEADVTGKALDAVSTALREQGQMAVKAGKFIAGLSAAVRPIITYWFVAVYSVVKGVSLYIAYQSGTDLQGLVNVAWTEQDWAIFSMILSFWFVGRVWERNGKSS